MDLLSARSLKQRKVKRKQALVVIYVKLWRNGI